MGNTNTSALRTAIVDGDVGVVQKLLQDPRVQGHLDQPLNRKGDTALILAARHGRVNIVQEIMKMSCNVNQENREHETALDVVLNATLPGDGDILHHHFCPFVQTPQPDNFQIPEAAILLLRAGCHGRSLERLILYVMKDTFLIGQVVDLIANLDNLEYFRLSGLLLQVCVWFQQETNVMTLLDRGVDLENFWKSSFMPRIQPSNYHRSVQWPVGEGGEYEIKQLPEYDGLQSLKFSFVQDWQADWNDGENPSAQYRAGLQMPPESAVLFIRAANSQAVLVHVMNDVMSYLPTTCSGPDLNETNLIKCLVSAGYVFTDEEMTHLHLKFGIDFSDYNSSLTQPKLLRQMCRISVRHSFKKNVFYSVSRLGVDFPPVLKRYLTLSEC